jgi:hypothetical protein
MKLERRLRKLEALSHDSTGLVPHSDEICLSIQSRWPLDRPANKAKRMPDCDERKRLERNADSVLTEVVKIIERQREDLKSVNQNELVLLYKSIAMPGCGFPSGVPS